MGDKQILATLGIPLSRPTVENPGHSLVYLEDF